jgi:cysteine synthase
MENFYDRAIRQELERARQVPLERHLSGDGSEIFLFRADTLSAGVKAPIGPGLVGAYLDQGLINAGTKALVVHGSGNTVRSVKIAVDQLGLALKVAAVVYKETSAAKKEKLLSSGIEVFSETSRSEGREGRLAVVKKLLRRKGWLLIEQHEQPLMVAIQKATFGKAIGEKMACHLPTHFVAGVGTGSTVFGISAALREIAPEIKVVAIEGLGSTLVLWHNYLKAKAAGLGFAGQKQAIESAIGRYAGLGVRYSLYAEEGPDPENWFLVEEIGDDFPPEMVLGIEGLGVGDPTDLIRSHLVGIDEVTVVTNQEAADGVAALAELGIKAAESAGANFWQARRLAEAASGRRVVAVVTAAA